MQQVLASGTSYRVGLCPLQSARTCHLASDPKIIKAEASNQSVLRGTEVNVDRRAFLLQGSAVLAGTALLPQPAEAIPGFSKSLVPKRRQKIPESEFKEGPGGLKYYDVEVGNGAVAKEGSRVAVHYDASWKGITFMTSRQGMGVTGGTPLGFDVGAKEAGGTLKGLDLGVRGMRVGGQRKLILPPELAYGDKGMREIPPNATLQMDVQLLSIKTSPFGFRTKLVEG